MYSSKQDTKFQIKRLLERSPVKLINLTNYLKKFILKLELFNSSTDGTDPTMPIIKNLKTTRAMSSNFRVGKFLQRVWNIF